MASYCTSPSSQLPFQSTIASEELDRGEVLEGISKLSLTSRNSSEDEPESEIRSGTSEQANINFEANFNSAGMSVLSQSPTFSGKTGENVNTFLQACKHAWSAAPFKTEEDREQVRATTVKIGVKGEAAVFMDYMTEEEQNSFEILSAKLRERFPWRRQIEENKSMILNQVVALTQGIQTMEQYAEQGRRVKNHAPAKYQDALAERRIEGLTRLDIQLSIKTVHGY